MANKRKCKYCGESKVRETMFIAGVSAFCNMEGAIKWSIENKHKHRIKVEKSERRANAKAKKNAVKTRKDAAKKACHAYIRARDSGQGCICCDKPLGENYHAGHWQESGSNSKIRYDEDNIHGQRLNCNFFKGGDSGQYKENLIKKIGLTRVKRLLNLQGGTLKRTAEDYQVIENHFKSKLKELNK